MTLLRRNAARATAFGIEARIVDVEEASQLYNGLIDKAQFKGGLWLPKDGSASPTDVTNAFAAGARMHGAQIFEGVSVDKVVTDNSQGYETAIGVRLDDGH